LPLLFWEQGVAGSSPVAPTTRFTAKTLKPEVRRLSHYVPESLPVQCASFADGR